MKTVTLPMKIIQFKIISKIILEKWQIIEQIDN